MLKHTMLIEPGPAEDGLQKDDYIEQGLIQPIHHHLWGVWDAASGCLFLRNGYGTNDIQLGLL